MSKVKLKQILTERLSLNQPEFKLEKIGSKLAGSIISPTFKGWTDRRRQEMIWKALDAELGPNSVLQIGTLLAYTPEEWSEWMKPAILTAPAIPILNAFSQHSRNRRQAHDSPLS